jgi:hypothetical protein
MLSLSPSPVILANIPRKQPAGIRICRQKVSGQENNWLESELEVPRLAFP